MDNNKEESVRKRAYSIWEEKGKPDGEHDSHWDQALQELSTADPGTSGKIPSDVVDASLQDKTSPAKKRARSAGK
jgi:hypothetical protein